MGEWCRSADLRVRSRSSKLKLCVNIRRLRCGGVLWAESPRSSHPKPLPILPRSAERHQALQNLLQVRRLGVGEVRGEFFRSHGMTRRMQRLFGGSDALGQRLGPGLFGSGLLDLLPLDPASAEEESRKQWVR